MDKAPSAPGPEGDAAPAAGGPGIQPLQFALTVPFPSPVEAEIAHRYLTPNAELQGPVRKELAVNGNFPTVLVLRCSGGGWWRVAGDGASSGGAVVGTGSAESQEGV
uniref:Uncharacterized protein n=1 Tax=Mustela putorius furo TaxID=9669 RepID=M3YEL0_MUSPF